MHSFQYKYGDRPLEGFTIERAVGRGGFGEVYYAVSDGGRQVALKVIQNYEQIELRGIKQCMNLKSPYLVTIFDVKFNEQNKPFVVMEYVSGPSLQDLLAESPGGLGEQKTAFFLREIGKGLSYLHECGVVHRDLKPGNIFYENGYVKIGDYGLSKAIQTGVHSAQTVTVGTVHYMAPEIGAGRYGSSIDIYALGILLYELLTGQVPFFGSSPAEVLMKHMTAEPDLSGISDTFINVIRKALAKDPADRYQSVQEMVEDVFGSEHIRNSVSQFSPESLSIVAAHVAQKARDAVAQQHPDGGSAQTAEIPRREQKDPTTWGDHIARQLNTVGDRIAGSITGKPEHQAGRKERTDYAAAENADPLLRRQRLLLGLIALVAVSLGSGMMAGNRAGFWGDVSTRVFFMSIAATLGILLARWKLCARMETESKWMRRCCIGISGTLCAMLLFLMFLGFGGPRNLTPNTAFALAIIFCITNWWGITTPRRKERVHLGYVVGYCFLAFFVASAFGTLASIVVGVVAGTMLVVQVITPFIPASAQTQKITDRGSSRKTRSTSPNAGEFETKRQATQAKNEKRRLKAARINVHIVAPAARLIFLIAFIIFLGWGIVGLILAGTELQGDDSIAAMCFGINAILLALLCFRKSLQLGFRSWYQYLVKPLILLLCLFSILTSSICLGSLPLREEEMIIALIFLIFPAFIFLVVLFVHSRVVEGFIGMRDPPPPIQSHTGSVSAYKRLWAFLLALCNLFFVAGLHRFYVGKIATGWVWLLTLGFFGVGTLIDIIMICTGNFKDKNGHPLAVWTNFNELQNRPPQPTPIVDNPVQPHHTQDPPAESPNTDSGQDPQPLMAYTTATPSGTIMANPVEPVNLMGIIFALLGYLLLVAGFLLGLLVAINLPVMIAAGFPDPQLAQELERGFGTPNWPYLLRQIAGWIAGSLILIAATCLIISRRKYNPMHMIRAVLGLLGLIISLLFVADSFSRIPIRFSDDYPIDQSHPGQLLEKIMRQTSPPELLWAAVFFLLSVVIFAWPPKKKPLPQPYPLPEGQ